MQRHVAEVAAQKPSGFADNPYTDLTTFLKLAGLAKVEDKFLNEGIDELNILASLSDEDLKSLGFNLGQRRKFANEITKWKAFWLWVWRLGEVGGGAAN